MLGGALTMLDHELVLPNLLRKRAADAPDRIFLQTVEGESFTAAETWQETLRWARAFAGLGLKEGERPAILLPTCPEALFAWIGAALLLAQQVPVNTGYRGQLLQHVLANSGARFIVTTAEFLPRLAEIDLAATAVKTLILLDGTAPDPPIPVIRCVDFFAGSVDVELRRPQGHDVASITYTSGTTGASKGVIVHWAQLYESSINPIRHGLGPDDCQYSPLPLFHVSGQMPVYVMALAGGRVVMRNGFSTREFLPDIRRFGCTVAVVLEAMASFLMSLPEAAGDADIPLHYVLTAPIPANVDAFRRRFGVRVGTGYNMTEIGSSLDGGPFDIDGSVAHNYCGKAKPPYQCRVVDEHDYVVAPGEFGELVICSDEPWTLNGGYLNAPEATLAVWRNGWFHTGDGFTCDEAGNFYFVSRIKDAIRRRGENISAQEVEAEILTHPAIAAAAVVAVPSEHGEDDVKAFLVLRDGASCDHAALIEYLRERLPHFMIPRYFERLDAMPLTPTSKVQKQALRDRGNGPQTWDREASGVQVKRA